MQITDYCNFNIYVGTIHVSSLQSIRKITYNQFVYGFPVRTKSGNVPFNTDTFYIPLPRQRSSNYFAITI
ncbi:hypothetical protein EMIT0P228_80017 [Pseudomonas brassicacearum]